jgi:long-chain fatty acid transport protein
MMKHALRLTTSIAALALAAPALATNGMRLVGFGPIQNAMGGASVAAPLDAAVLVTNPAGLSELGPRIDLSGGLIAPSVEYRATGLASGQKIDSDRPPTFLPTLAMVYRADERFTLGLAAVATAGLGVDYPADLYGGATYTSFEIARLAPAASYRITDRISFGAALNVMYATLGYELGGGMQMEPREKASAFGLGATVGLSWRPIDAVTLAAAYETRSRFQDFAFDVPSHTILTPGGPVTVAGGEETLALDQPQSATLGVAVRPVAPLLLAADVQWVRWSEVVGAGQPELTSDPAVTGAQQFDLRWDDQLVLKVGAEWAATPALRLRAGYNYGKSPLDPDRAVENLAFPAVSEHHFTAGAGWEHGPLAVNASVAFSPKSELEGANAAQGILAYETSMSQLGFELGMAWRF